MTKRTGISAAAFMAGYSNAGHTTKPKEHKTDADCAGLVGADGLCAVCGVDHTGECPECGGHGYHCDKCSEVYVEAKRGDDGCDTLADARGER